MDERVDAGKIIHTTFLVEGVKTFWLKVVMKPVEDWLVRHQVQPNTITLVGFGITLVASGLLATNHLIWGGWVLIAGGCCDFLDGRVARRTGHQTEAGAFFDSCLDRYMDAAVFFGLAILFHGNLILLALVYAGLLGAMTTPYFRAKSESLGISASGGAMQRPERVVYVAATSILSGYFACVMYPFGEAREEMPPYFLMGAVALIAWSSNRSALSRFFGTWSILKSRSRTPQ